MAIQTHRQWQRVLRVSSYLSLITWDGLLFCGGSATWRCNAHANEPLPVCGRAYGQGSWGEDGETWVRRPESGLLSQPLTMRHMEVGRETEGEGVAHVLHLLLPSFICQRLTQSPQTWKTEVFSLLCHYQEIIICCCVPRRQSGLRQTTKQASAWGIWKIYQHFPAWDTSMSCGTNLFWKTH